MADVAISALSAVAAAASAQELPTNDSGTTRKVTIAQMQSLLANPSSNEGDDLGTTALRWLNCFLGSGGKIDFNNGNVTLTHSSGKVTLAGGGLVLAAGTTTLAPLQFTSGTNLTATVAGGVEYDGKVFYAATEANQRGVVRAESVICLSSTHTLANVSTEQALFDGGGGPANGALDLPTGTYFFEQMVSMSAMSGTSGNWTFDLLGAGTATVGSVLFHCLGIDSNTGSAGAQSGSWSVAAQQPSAVVQAAVNTGCQTLHRGTFRVTGAGTIIPSGALANAAAAVMAIGCYFRCWCIGSSSMVTVGKWS